MTANHSLIKGQKTTVMLTGALVVLMCAVGHLVSQEEDTDRDQDPVVLEKQAHGSNGSGANPVTVSFSPSGKWLVTAGWNDKKTILWDTESGEEIRRFQGHRAGIQAITFGPDGNRLFTASTDQTVKTWEPETGRELNSFRRPLQDPEDGTATGDVPAEFVGNGSVLVSGYRDGRGRVWSVSDQSLSFKISPQEEAGPKARRIMCADLSSDGSTLVTGGPSTGIRFWSVKSGTKSKTLDLPDATRKAFHLARHPKKPILVAGLSGRPRICAWNTNTDKQITLDANIGPNWKVYDVSFSNDGKWFVIGTRGKKPGAYVYRSDDWNPDKTISLDPVLKHKHKTNVWAVAFHPDGTHIAFGDEHGGVVLRKFTKGE